MMRPKREMDAAGLQTANLPFREEDARWRAAH